ncbi:pantoate--beta-alanine ligase [Corynebacterium poyangense]|uniref:pantoate--beta-alanine ligase n=1 Tax=Corynebacterium poyangense TaxID=2684405 RepID=UPI00165D169F|nr:pantoate--beta-alanine ligase [Corynebacterium poyangense]
MSDQQPTRPQSSRYTPGELQIHHSAADVAQVSRALRTTGRPIVVVPTGPELHPGNIELIRAAAALPRALIMVAMPDQSLEGDREAEITAILRREKAEILLLADPPALRTRVHSSLTTVDSAELCRLMWLMNATSCTDVVLGERDYELLIATQQMIADFVIPVRLHAIPVIRDHDGLAFSRLTQSLSQDVREEAVGLSAALTAAAFVADQGREHVLRVFADTIAACPHLKLHSVQLSRPTLDPLRDGDVEARLIAEVELSTGGRLRDSVGVVLVDRDREIAAAALEAAGLDPHLSAEEWAQIKELQSQVQQVKARREASQD